MRPKLKDAGFYWWAEWIFTTDTGGVWWSQEAQPNHHQAREGIDGEAKEGYWTAKKLMRQMKAAVKIAEVKYPRMEGWKLVWIFDHNSCHTAMPDDVLDVSKMNVNPGGKQRVMRDGFWDGKPHKMNFALGVPKGMRIMLTKQGIDASKMNADKMREVLGSHRDFRDEKSMLERFLVE